MSEGADLPDGWIECALGDVVEYGATIKAEPAQIPDDAWVLELEDIEKDTSRVGQRLTFRERRSKSTKSRFDAGQVLYGKLRPYLNKVIVADRPGYCTTEIVPIRAPEGLSAKFLFYWLKHPRFLQYVSNASHGMSMPRLGTDAARRAPFLLAPSSEQRRIVAKLEPLLVRSRRAKDALDAVPLLLKRFRQSVLAAAFRGDLTKDWREKNPDVAPVEKMPEGFQYARATGNKALKRGAAGISEQLPRGWRWARVEDLSEGAGKDIFAGPFGTIFKAKDFRPSGVPIIFLRHVAPGRYLTSKPGFMDEAVWHERFRDYSVFGGELLVTKLGEPPGVAAIYPKGIGPAMVTPDVIAMRVSPKRALTSFLMHYLNSDQARRVAFGLAFGSTRLRLTLPIFRTLAVPLPSLEEQAAAVEAIDCAFSAVEAVETALGETEDKLSKLDQAMLGKAFRGDLVPQDPGDEPASDLLKRIRAASERAHYKSRSFARSATAKSRSPDDAHPRRPEADPADSQAHDPRPRLRSPVVPRRRPRAQDHRRRARPAPAVDSSE